MKKSLCEGPELYGILRPLVQWTYPPPLKSNFDPYFTVVFTLDIHINEINSIFNI